MTKAEALAAMQRMTPEEREAMIAKRKAEAEVRLGGFLEIAPTGNVIRVVNRQTVVPEVIVAAAAREVCDTIGATMEVVGDNSGDEAKVAVRIELVEDGAGPVLLVAPEDKFGRLNVARLATDNPSPMLLKSRFDKEFWRVAGMTLGGFNSSYSPCVMRNIYSLGDLDKDPAACPSPEVFDKMQGTCRQLGIMRPRRISYRRACQEGIAPQPTNDVQRAIYEQARADKERGPSNPILIKPEPKR